MHITCCVNSKYFSLHASTEGDWGYRFFQSKPRDQRKVLGVAACVTDDRRVEAMRNGDSISWLFGWRVVSLRFLVNCFLLPEFKEMK